MTRPKAAVMLEPGDVMVITGKEYRFTGWTTTNTPLTLEVKGVDDEGHDLRFMVKHDQLIQVKC